MPRLRTLVFHKIGIEPKLREACVAGRERHVCSHMKGRRIFRWPWWSLILAALTLTALAMVAIRPIREPVLRAAGWALVVNNEPLAPADIIICALPVEEGTARGASWVMASLPIGASALG